MDLPGKITSLDQLEARYRSPVQRVLDKVNDRIDEASATFIDQCRFLVLATSDGSSLDASPRGGPAGFVQRLDDRHIAIPDLIGNNRLDSFRNIVNSGRAGVLMVVPGQDETVRVNGPAALTDDAEILASFPSELRPPKLAIVLETQELYGHCAKAFRRGEVWDHQVWAESDEVPDLAAMYASQFATMDESEARALIDEVYETELAHDRAEDS